MMEDPPDESDKNPTEQESTALTIPVDMLSQLQERRKLVTEMFRKRVEEAGGAVPWLSSRCPRVRSSLASVITDPERMEEIVLRETESFWTGHEVRLGECGRCPKDGAACADTNDRVNEGILVKLEVKGNVPIELQKPCNRYYDFRLARRLSESGVDKRLCRVKLPDLSPEPLPHVVKAFDTFIASGQGKSAPSDVQMLIEGEKAREYGVALLRSAMRNYRNASYRSVHVPSLAETVRNAMTVKEPSPLIELADYDVLLLDAVEHDSIKPKSWFRKRLELLYSRRRDNSLATIITSSIPCKEAFPGVSVLKI